MGAAEGRLGELKKELASLGAASPESVAAVGREAEEAAAAANRWTDNIEAVKVIFLILTSPSSEMEECGFESWCKKNFGMDGAQMDEQFGIPPELDYVD